MHKINEIKILVLFIFLCMFETQIGYSQFIPWYRVWNSEGRDSEGKIVVQTYDSGYAILSQVSLYSVGNVCYQLVKYDNAGNFLFATLIADTVDTYRQLYEFKQTSDSGFIFAGGSHGPLLIRTDKYGNVKWLKKYTNFSSYSEFYNVNQTNDYGFISCGYNLISSPPGQKAIIVKTDSLGNIQWIRQFNDSLMNAFGSVIQDSLSNYYVSGGIYNSSSNPWGIIKKLDSSGNQIWNTVYSPNTYGSYGSYILYSGSNDIIIAGGEKYSFHPKIAKLDTSGNVKWVKNYTFPEFQYACLDKCNNIVICGDYAPGGYYPTIGLLKIDTSGNVKDSTTFQYSGYDAIYPNCINTTYDKGFILSGSVGTGDSLIILYSTTLIIKTDSAFNLPIITIIRNEQNQTTNELILKQNYPNPFNSFTIIKFSIPDDESIFINIYDVLGRTVFRNNQNVKSGMNEIRLDFNSLNLSSGIYFFNLKTKREFKTIKLLYLK